MPNKIQDIKELTIDKIKEVSKEESNWVKFLNSASYNYKYPFEHQIMIYAQRPSATACADINTWNTKLHRWLKKDSKRNCLVKRHRKQ